MTDRSFRNSCIGGPSLLKVEDGQGHWIFELLQLTVTIRSCGRGWRIGWRGRCWALPLLRRQPILVTQGYNR